MSICLDEVSRGERFAFGRNWRAFIESLTEEQIVVAEQTLLTMLECRSLEGMTFLDIGSGSGLVSLAARRLGASVHSFDLDPDSVACTRALRDRQFPDDLKWHIDEASILDEHYLRELPPFDVVYAWGVLHHTGKLATALRNAAVPVAPHGVLFLAIYNDQGWLSRVWLTIKRIYCSGRFGRWTICAAIIPVFAAITVLLGLLRHGSPVGVFRHYRERRGMSVYHDWLDWLGGYPFEPAKPETILHVYRELGFRLRNLTTTNRLGCNQFVFENVGSPMVTQRPYWMTARIDGLDLQTFDEPEFVAEDESRMAPITSSVTASPLPR